MLVLTRKLQQQIKIGDSITVTVLRVKGNTVRIGVQAPREVRVVRSELPKEDSGPEAVDLPLPGVPTALVADEPQNEAGSAPASPPAQTELPKPAHLPLRKIRGRRGNGPLKQMVAACATLAK